MSTNALPPFCSAHREHLGERITTSGSPGRPISDIQGTWDFKWQPGTKIRVAVQEPDNDCPNLENLRELFREKATKWTEGINLFFDIDSERTVPKNPTKYVGYDILLCFRKSDEHSRGSWSHIGDYAQRQDFGEPTTMLVIPACGPNGKRFEATVTHEIGHIIGLPHEHQSPHRKSKCKWKDVKKIREILEIWWKAKDLFPTDDDWDKFIRSEITMPWPGTIRFSDWRDPSEELHDTVMTYPAIEHLIEGKPKPDKLPDELLMDWYEKHSSPTQKDIDFVKKMYGEAP